MSRAGPNMTDIPALDIAMVAGETSGDLLASLAELTPAVEA